MTRRLLFTIAAVLFAIAVDGALSSLINRTSATPPSAPTFYVVDTRCTEDVKSCTVAISASGGNGRGSWINAATSNGTATAPTDYSARSSPIYVSPGRTTSVSIPIIDDSLVEGDEYFFVTITAQQNAQIGRARGVVTIVDNDLPPPPTVTWTKCAGEGGICLLLSPANVRYGAGTTWTAPRAVAGSIDCSNATWGDPLFGVPKQCQTDGQPASPLPPPPPPPISTVWILTGQPPVFGGYGWHTNQGPCCNGEIVRIVDHGTTTDSKPTDWWLVQFYADPSGNFPLSNPYWTSNQGYLFGGELVGVAPVGG